MHDFPLLSFLRSLERDGLFLAVRDYDRIAHVLGMDGEWTLGRLKHVLLALLAKDLEQRELLMRRFDDAFDPNLPGLPEGWDAKLNIEKIRHDLARLPKGYDRAADLGQKRAPTRQPTIQQSRWARFIGFFRPVPWLKPTPLSLLILVVLLGLARDSLIVEPLANCQIDPPSHFLSAEPGKDQSFEMAVVNLGGGQVKPGAITVEGEGFSLKSHHCDGQTLATGQRCGVNLGFRSDKPGQFTGKLKVRSDKGEVESLINVQSQSAEIQAVSHSDELSKLPVVVYQPRQPYIKSIRSIPNPGQDDWKRLAWAAAILLGLNIAFALYLHRYRNFPIDPAPPWNADKPRHFSFERVGGVPAPRLDRATLAYLADCMDYFRSDQASHRPDLRASVLATVRQGGIPNLRFLQRKQLRQLVILEDGQAGDIARRNPIAQELAEGMVRLGVEVLSGRYYVDPAVGWDGQGRAFYLDDLEAQRGGLLLLIVGEAERARQDSRLALERLARWPHRAWIDLTPAESRDPRPTLPERLGLPVYPATVAGLLEVFEHFLSETGGRGIESALSRQGSGRVRSACLTLPFGTRSVPYGLQTLGLETRLGDALPWAAACALIQPFSFGLADRLRRKYFPHLLAERIERLVALPGSLATAEGVRFGDSTAQVLQGLFFNRLPEAQQRDIAGFMLQGLDEAWAEQAEADPQLEDSPARLAWERRYEQIRLLREPEAALKRLSELNGTPLGSTLR